MDIQKRSGALDQFRGLAILFMVFVNSIAQYPAVPAWLKHAKANGITFADFILPMFLFGIGWAGSFSFQKRLTADGPFKTVRHFLFRYGLLFLFGLAGELLMNDSGHWGVLEALATAGAFSLPFLFLKPNWRLAFAAVFLIGYQAAVLIWKIPLISYFEESGLAGPFASFAWGFIVLAGSFVSELFLKDGKGPKRNKLIPFGLAAGVAGVLLGIWLPFNKHEASVSYILLTTGACCILAWLLTFYQSIEEHSTSSVQDRAGWVLVILGKNSLILYMLSSVIILPENALIQTTSPLWLVFTGTLAVLAVVYAVGWFLQRFKIIIKL